MPATRSPLPTRLTARPPAFAMVAGRVLRDELDGYAPATVVLWQLAGSAHRFAEAPEWERAGALDGRGALPLDALEELGAAWVPAAEALRAAMYAGETAAAVERASELASLAAGAGLPLAAGMLAEAAALMMPAEPRLALAVATFARDRADHPASEWWGRRAALIARLLKDWETAVHGWARVADSFNQRGSFARSLSARRRAVQAARRSRRRELQARALHSLFAEHFEIGDIHRARDLAPRLLHLYPNGHPRLLNLAHDLALIELYDGNAAGALRVFIGLRNVIDEPRDQLILAVSMAHAAACCGNTRAFEEAAEDTFLALRALRFGEGAAWALAELSAAAVTAGEPARAREWSRLAEWMAESRGERAALRTARRTLARVR